MVQEQSRKYELHGLKTRGGQPIILEARDHAGTLKGRGAMRLNGAEQWRRGASNRRSSCWRPEARLRIFSQRDFGQRDFSPGDSLKIRRGLLATGTKIRRTENPPGFELGGNLSSGFSLFSCEQRLQRARVQPNDEYHDDSASAHCSA